MKTLLRLPLALFSLLLAGALPLAAQVTTGTIEKWDMATGALTVRSDQTRGPLLIQGADKAILEQVQGEAPSLADLKEGMAVTIQYAQRNNVWYASKITYGSQPTTTPAVPPGLTPGTTGTSTLNPNNTRVTVNPNNTSVTVNPNNTRMTVNPNNTSVTVNPNNTSVAPSGDGGTLTRNRGGGNAPRVVGGGK